MPTDESSWDETTATSGCCPRLGQGHLEVANVDGPCGSDRWHEAFAYSPKGKWLPTVQWDEYHRGIVTFRLFRRLHHVDESQHLLREASQNRHHTIILAQVWPITHMLPCVVDFLRPGIQSHGCRGEAKLIRVHV